jgi:hypothetical protein
MNEMIVANATALGAAQVVLVALLAVVILLCVRALSHILRVPLTRLVSHMLDGSIVVLFILFIILVIVRFKTVG